MAFWKFGVQFLIQNNLFQRGLADAASVSNSISRRCIQVFLLSYDVLAPLASIALGRVVLRALKSNGVSIEAWRRRNEYYCLFEHTGGPSVTIQRLLSQGNQKPLNKCLDEAGLTGMLAAGGYSCAMLLDWCTRAHERPWEKLAVVEEWKRLCSGALAGREHLMVERLLFRWRSEDPPAEWRKPLLEMLIRLYGDPRDVNTGVWSLVREEFRQIVMRWLTLQTIEDFFDALDDYARSLPGGDAMQRQWPYRRALWLAYYRQGVVLDAKPAIGRHMEERLGWSSIQSRFGKRVARLESADPDQSALILRLRGFIVFVGTHNASCRIWDETSPSAPNLKSIRFRYSDIVTFPRSDLQIDPYASDTGIRHAGSENGNWQRKVAEFLRRKLGVAIPDYELMP